MTKHITNLADEEIEKLTDKISEELADFMKRLVTEYDICNVCLHNVVIMMCNAYLDRTEGVDNGVRH